jgi:GT2 family glycosyltransferase
MISNKFINEITIILISYQSYHKIKNFLRLISKSFKIIIIENSKDESVLRFKSKNIKVYIRKNNGISSSINYACKKIKTKYFFHFSPDLKITNNDISKVHAAAKLLKDKFAVIGPRFKNADPKSHKQSDITKKLCKIDAVHGSAMFVNKKNYIRIGKFDENFFLFFEENDFCKRGNNLSLYSYQLNSVKITNNINGSIKYKNIEEKKNIKNIYYWHFIWSKYYFTKKHYGIILTTVYFIPIIIRILYRIIIYTLTADIKINKYKNRFQGLLCSMLGKSSYLRPKR